jgi:hypothetical protein
VELKTVFVNEPADENQALKLSTHSLSVSVSRAWNLYRKTTDRGKQKAGMRAAAMKRNERLIHLIIGSFLD